MEHMKRLLIIGSVVLAACQSPPPAPPVVVSPVPPPVVTPVAPPAPPVPPRIGLALGGGAARGFAHIGVIQVLEDAGFKIDLVAGTSAGSLVAALWASGLDGAELGRLAQSMEESAIADWGFPGRGLLRGDALARFVRDRTGGKLIEQMPRPLGIVATDLDSGDAILFQRGDTGQAVRASSAVPAVFLPVKIGPREYVDGGLVSPVPVSHARRMGAGLVIAVDISDTPEGKATGDPFRMLLQTFAIMGRSINRYELKDADLVIRPALAGVSGTDFSARQRAIDAGREAARAALPRLRARLAELTK
jgi:NTE family protein